MMSQATGREAGISMKRRFYDRALPFARMKSRGDG